KDANGDMLADPPSDSAELINPRKLILAHYEGDNEEEPCVDWEAFRDQLARATGKEVELRSYLHTADDVAAVAKGDVQVLALHAAEVPFVVNEAGFIPVATLGSEAGANGNHMVIAVASKSPVRSLQDLRDRKLTCTQPDSITG